VYHLVVYNPSIVRKSQQMVSTLHGASVRTRPWDAPRWIPYYPLLRPQLRVAEIVVRRLGESPSSPEILPNTTCKAITFTPTNDDHTLKQDLSPDSFDSSLQPCQGLYSFDLLLILASRRTGVRVARMCSAVPSGSSAIRKLAIHGLLVGDDSN
jgi:hypothetical protein